MAIFSTLFLFCLAHSLSTAESKATVNFEHTNHGFSSSLQSARDNSASAKAKAFVAQLNLTEKANMVTGSYAAGSCIGNIAAVKRLGFQGLCMSDGPTAVNRADLVSVFPAGLTVAATWDKNLMYERYLALGNEFKAKGSHVGLGPVAGPLGRHPLGGRNWEGFSPDPYLTGIAMDASVRGFIKAGVQSCSKHFIGNEQETQRSNTTSESGQNIDGVSANIDDRTLHELYLWPFADAVKAGTPSIMCSYNRLNQTYSCENSELLNGILKKELGFEGYVVSDWFATHSGVKSINAGLDMSMPGASSQSAITTGETYFGKHVVEAVTNGSVSVSRLDDMIVRIMTPYFALGQDHNYPTVDPSAIGVLSNLYGISLGSEVPARDVRANHASLIREIGADGIVLLKNVNSTLPLKSPKTIGVFGNDAADPTNGLVLVDGIGVEYGTLDVGGGSGTGGNTYVVSPLEAIKTKARQLGARVEYITNNTMLAAGDFRTIYPTPDVCLVFLKTFASEGADRTSFENDWNSTLVVNSVAKRCPNTVVITHSGGVNTLPWANNTNVKAILAAHYPGQESGNSLVDVLWGSVNPSGKLPYTIPAQESDYDIPITNITNGTTETWQSDFTEGLMIDYRHFDSKNITPLYEFGFGLSYTQFTLSSTVSIENLGKKVAATPDSSRKIVPGGNPDLYTPLIHATTTVSNTGKVAGATVVQLYLSMPQGTVPTGTPVKVLRGFEKVYLKPGEKKQVAFTLARRDLSYWDTTAQTWRIPDGQFTLRAGFSSRDLKATKEFRVI